MESIQLRVAQSRLILTQAFKDGDINFDQYLLACQNLDMPSIELVQDSPQPNHIRH
jgi:hypothetical protein